MNDKKFDETMRNYVADKSLGQDMDFRKLDQKTNVSVAAGRNRKIAWSAISVVMVLVVTLAIALPLTMPMDNEGTDIRYADSDNDFVFISLATADDFSAKYGIDAMLPTIECQLEKVFTVIASRTDQVVFGAHIGLPVFDDIFDNIDVHIVPENRVIYYLTAYENLLRETSWQNTTVRYSVDYHELDGSYHTRLYFRLDGNKYYIDAVYYEELEIAELLDLVF